jgi:hypothetical protein
LDSQEIPGKLFLDMKGQEIQPPPLNFLAHAYWIFYKYYLKSQGYLTHQSNQQTAKIGERRWRALHASA